jgi:CBS domain-containing protein
MGEWIAYGVMGVGVVYVIFGGFVMGIWFFLIGLFLKNAAAGSYGAEVQESTLTGVPVSAAMRTDVEEIPPDMKIDELVREHILPRGSRCFAIVVGQILGLVTLTDVRKVPQDAWATTSVYRAMTPADELVTVSPDEELKQALQLLATHDVNQLPVVRGRTLVGMITRSDLLAFMKVREDIGALSRQPAHDAANQADRPASEHPVGS